MAKKKNRSKYPPTDSGYLAYLFDTGATFSLNLINRQTIMVVANNGGNINYTSFTLDRAYIDPIADIKNNILTNKYEIVNMRMY